MATLIKKIIIVIFLYSLTFSAFAFEKFVQLDSGRNGAAIPIYVMSQSGAKSTILLLPGGNAETGKIEFPSGKPGSQNFLSRTRELFRSEGFNVIVVYRPTDMTDLTTDYRISNQHSSEIERVVQYANKEFNVPVWLIGTSRGTVSATAAAIALGDSVVKGLVLTSSVTARKNNGVNSQEISAIKVPVLVVHHKNDECRICVPEDAAKIISKMKSSPTSKYVEIVGGFGPTGDPCEAKHWHGFVNYEKETVSLIASWIKTAGG